MSTFFAFLTLGVLQGMTYGIVALGMVLIYKGTRVLNLAQPFMGLYAAFLCWYLTGTPGSLESGLGQGLATGPVFIRWLEYPSLLFLFDVGSRPRFLLAVFWSLLLIARLRSRQLARRVQVGVEWHPDPPFGPVDFDRVRESATKTHAIEILGPPPF
jgi:branched-subunit amino acid ABC-type transport system permease component